MSGNLNLNNINDGAVKDIIELQQKIKAVKAGKLNEERFKHYRLTRGVYGQRQIGVQMFRTKIPFGKLTTEQLVRLADVSEKFTNGNLHLTTRQNIQLHHIKLDDTPALWTALAEVDVTARGACGNTVRNITASAIAGIDPNELFDVSPYVKAAHDFFLRNPICQEMGRKIKPAFSSSDQDSAFGYFHDFGFIPRIKIIDGEEVRGFKVLLAGGLGAQAMIAPTAFEFLAADKIIPFMEATLRVFDRYGEREKRFKARMKFLLKKLGLEELLKLIAEEQKNLSHATYPIDVTNFEQAELPIFDITKVEKPNNIQKFEAWIDSNVFEQKQEGWFAANIKLFLGDLSAKKARELTVAVERYAADDIRLTVNQGILLRFIPPAYLPALFNKLDEIGLAEPGFDGIADVTACPGTDTCNLAVTNSTGLAGALEELAKNEYPQLINDKNIKIKISGCMNSCGQHMAASIGFHGSSIKKNGKVIPAMQIVLGGGVDPKGKGFIAEKVIKLPTKRTPDAVRLILNNYLEHTEGNIFFNDYFQSKGKRYFYDLLKPLSETDQLTEADFRDWGENTEYKQAIGVGECAGVAYDVVATIIGDALEKLALSREALEQKAWADSAYHVYSAFVVGAKALLLLKDVKCNTQIGIVRDFQKHYVETEEFNLDQDFEELVLQIKKQKADEPFTTGFLNKAESFVKQVIEIRESQLGEEDKTVLSNYYNA